MTRFVTLLLFLYTVDASACSCAYRALDNRAVQEAQSIFIFRLASAAATERDEVKEPWSKSHVSGKIDAIQVLKGEAVTIDTIEYNTNACCGTRLDVGKYYVAFLPETPAEFFGHPGNMLEIGGGDSVSWAKERLKGVVSGDRTIESIWGEFPSERLFQVSRPPPPCPRKGGS